VCVAPDNVFLRLLSSGFSADSNAVTVIFTVEDVFGAPYPSLGPSLFSLIEDDDQPAVGYNADWTMQPTSSWLSTFQALLIDQLQVSTDESLHAFKQYATSWITAVLATEGAWAAVFLYSGQSSLTVLVPWTEDSALAVEQIGQLTVRQKDHSSNVFGGLVSVLTEHFPTTHKAALFAVYVVVETTDHAHRYSAVEAQTVASSRPVAIFATDATATGKIDKEFWSSVTADSNPVTFSAGNSPVNESLTRQTELFRWHQQRLYRIVYCSSSRHGSHTLNLNAIHSNTLQVEFVASELKEECIPDNHTAGAILLDNLYKQLTTDRCRVPADLGELTPEQVDRILKGILIVAILFVIWLLQYLWSEIRDKDDLCRCRRCCPGGGDVYWSSGMD
jgi:hypothetical protein